MTDSKRMTRRKFLAAGLLGGGALAISSVPVRVLAQGGRVSEDEPAAAALGYKHNAADVDTAKFPKRAGAGASQLCNNCALYQGGTADAWAPCSIFQNREVAGAGWCNAWVAKPA